MQRETQRGNLERRFIGGVYDFSLLCVHLHKPTLGASSFNAFEIDSKQVDISRIESSLESNPNGVLALYNHLLEKGIIEP